MCTAGLRKFHLYERSFAKYAASAEAVYPNDEVQCWVTKGICNAKNNYRFTQKDIEPEHPWNYFQKVCDYYAQKNINCIIGGCTDISNVFTYENNDVKYVDSLNVLAEVINKKY